MTNGRTVAMRLRGPDSGGIPWMVILSPKGEKLITSDAPAPTGNIGYPFETPEIEYFIVMLQKTATRIKPEQITEVEEALKDYAKKRRGS